MTNSCQRGFTLVELLVAAAVFSVISASVLTMVASTYRRYTIEAARNDTTWQGRAAVDLLVRELRVAGYPAQNTYSAAAITAANSNLVATTFLTATPTRVVFEADLDDNGIVERVEYRLTGTTLERSAISKNADGSVPATNYEPLATPVMNGAVPLFTYTTDPNSGQAFPRNVNSVGVQLLLRSTNGSLPNQSLQTLRFDGVAYRHNPDR